MHGGAAMLVVEVLHTTFYTAEGHSAPPGGKFLYAGGSVGRELVAVSHLASGIGSVPEESGC